MEGENAHANGEYGNRRRDTLPYPVYVTNSKHWSLSLLYTYSPTPAREKSLNFFAFEQQQMGNWPTNCCDDLGLPISARSSTIPEPVQARTAPDVCIRAIGETTLRPLYSRSYPTNK